MKDKPTQHDIHEYIKAEGLLTASEALIRGVLSPIFRRDDIDAYLKNRW